MTRVAFLALVLAACGSDSTSKKPDAAAQKDAAKLADAAIDAPQHVFAITCPPAPAATIMTNDGAFAYMPNSVTIAQNGIVLFIMSNIHDVVPDATNSDPGLSVGFAESKCLQFTTTGTFGFHCGPHGFTGSVTVN